MNNISVDLNRLLKCALKGHDYQFVAKRMGVSTTSIKRWLRGDWLPEFYRRDEHRLVLINILMEDKENTRVGYIGV